MSNSDTPQRAFADADRVALMRLEIGPPATDDTARIDAHPVGVDARVLLATAPLGRLLGYSRGLAQLTAGTCPGSVVPERL